MGGRGASSGVSVKGNPYGTQYKTLIEDGSIRFVTKNIRQSETLMETMTPGRIYVETGGNDLLRIVSFDQENKRSHVIELDKRSGEWHRHTGYFHTENGTSKHEQLTDADKELLAKVKRIWHNKHSKV